MSRSAMSSQGLLGKKIKEIRLILSQAKTLLLAKMMI